MTSRHNRNTNVHFYNQLTLRLTNILASIKKISGTENTLFESPSSIFLEYNNTFLQSLSSHNKPKRSSSSSQNVIKLKGLAWRRYHLFTTASKFHQRLLKIPFQNGNVFISDEILLNIANKSWNEETPLLKEVSFNTQLHYYFLKF